MKKLTLLLCFLLAVPTTAAAEDGIFTPVSVRASGSMIGDADFKDSGGSAQVTTARLSIKSGLFSFGYERRNYDWSDKAGLNFGNGNDDPWETLHRLTLGFEYGDEINDDWGYSFALTGSSSFEEEMSGSYGGALRAGFDYAFNDNWSTMFGGRIFTNSVESSVMPYLGITYEGFDRDGSGYFMTLGAPSAEAGYAISEQLKFRLSFDMEGRTTRLKDNSSVTRKGYLSTESMVTALYCDWKPTEALSISFGPEYHFGRKMKFYDSDGNKFGDTIKQGSALGGRLQFGYKF